MNRKEVKGIFINLQECFHTHGQEVFGRAARIILADDKIAAVRLASIWTEDLDNAEKLSRMIRSGIVTYSDPRVPSGGVKKGGFGRVVKVW